jgi:hypothetical protein
MLMEIPAYPLVATEGRAGLALLITFFLNQLSLSGVFHFDAPAAMSLSVKVLI